MKFVGLQTGALCGAPNRATTDVHIRNKPSNRNERPLYARADLDSRYSALVWAVLVDRSLEPIDRCVYACLAARAFKGNSVRVGGRWIAESLGVRKGRVQSSIARLIAAKHVEMIEPSRGALPAVYRLTSSVFSARQDVIVTDKQGTRKTTRIDIEKSIELARKLRRANA